MNTTQAQQKALDDALVTPADRLEFRKCNMRLKTDIKPKEVTFQIKFKDLPGNMASLHSLDGYKGPNYIKPWGMFHKKNIDYVYLLWEDLLFRIENKDAKKTNKMSCPRFTKIIIDYFMAKDSKSEKRLIRTNELYKFSDGTLNDVRSALHDIAAGIRMEYLPMRKWSNFDKKRARVMVQDIDKQLYQRRLMRNLEKFVGGRIYRKDLRLMERTI
ncbi:hypothetical protein Tco_1524908 [Tanacetum coccineum]